MSKGKEKEREPQRDSGRKGIERRREREMCVACVSPHFMKNVAEQYYATIFYLYLCIYLYGNKWNEAQIFIIAK